MQTKNTKQGGFTLVEIAIVLVIIGLLLGGILKGQELINNAKVRSVADRQNSLKAAWFGFIDRYNFIPGDSKRARQLVPGAKKRGTSDTQAGDGILTLGESVLAMQQLTGAGFLRCPQCDGDGNPAAPDEDATITAAPTADNSLVNQYSGVMSIWNDSNQYAFRGLTPGAAGRLQIHSGPRIPSNILSEVDRKIDDGVANAGDMVFNAFDPIPTDNQVADAGKGTAIVPVPDAVPTNGAPSSQECINEVENFEGQADSGSLNSAEDLFWRSSNLEPAVENNCGASVFI